MRSAAFHFSLHYRFILFLFSQVIVENSENASFAICSSQRRCLKMSCFVKKTHLQPCSTVCEYAFLRWFSEFLDGFTGP